MSSDSHWRNKQKKVKKPPQPPPQKKVKAVVASEIKSFLYSWCGMRKLKPNYEMVHKGIQPDVYFECTLTVPGIDHSVFMTAHNKKDAQSRACWDFCDYLVKVGKISEKELPPRPIAPALGEQPVQGNTIIKNTKESDLEIHTQGGWTMQNASVRLNQFLQREHTHLQTDYHESGSDHARIFTCEMRLQVYAIQKELDSYERGTTKKQAAALCSLKLIRKLFKNNLIERFGDPVIPLDIDTSMNEYSAKKHYFVPEVVVRKNQGNSKKVKKLIQEQKDDQGTKKNVEMVSQLDFNLKSLHQQICPKPQVIQSMLKATQTCEFALTQVAQELQGENSIVLQGVVRVGKLSKGLLLNGDRDVHIILFSVDVPTVDLYSEVYTLLCASLSKSLKVELVRMQDKATILAKFAKDDIEKFDVDVQVFIHFTSSKFKNTSIAEDFNENVLNVKSCLFALREFRNFKWFQTSAIDFPFCLEIIRIFKDIVRKNREWRNLKNFTIELLVTRLLKTMQSEDVTLANCFRRVLEAIAGGLFLEDGNGVLDPCENTQIDGADLINEQNSEELTFAAQIALRQAAFGQSHKLLGIKEVNLVS